MNHVYVPWKDEGMDKFASMLVTAKNASFLGRYKLIERDIGQKPLANIGWPSSLYICLHGQSKAFGVGAYKKKDGTWQDVSGADLVLKLLADGLPNSSIDLRLWTCFGAASYESPAVDRDAPTEGYFGDTRSFAAKVCAGFKERGYKKISVTGYKEPVSISGAALGIRDNKKSLLVNGQFVAAASESLKFP